MTSDDLHRAAVEAWRRARYGRLRQDAGWLTLAGLEWLRPGVNRVGRDPGAEAVLPAGPPWAGTVTLTDGGIVADGSFTQAGTPADGLRLETDLLGEPTMLELGSLRFCAIQRGGRFALRIWDTDSALRREFEGIPHWPVDPAWRLSARLEATPGRTVRVPDVIGTIDDLESPGDLLFEAGGTTHRLQALVGGDTGALWLVFGDATNGAETYDGGRFLYLDAPNADGTVEVDFNRAYNPPCVFSPYATCPLPWPENRLPVRIEAGERGWDRH
jgi:uncharacterized protein (DUF1684 family)